MRWLTLLFLVATACAPSGDVGDDDPGGDDGPTECECNDYLSCSDGLVRGGGPSSCTRCGGTETHLCMHGCWSSSGPDNGSYEDLCFEAHSRSPGDPCTTDDDCLPTPAHEVGGELNNLYLECEAGGGVCVLSAPPEPSADHFGACDPLAIEPFLAESSRGYLEDPTCSTGLCWLGSFTTGCDRAGCVMPCEHDWECPLETRCDATLSLTGEPSRGVCLPLVPRDWIGCV